MKEGSKSILIDLERLKYPFTGLYSYAMSLGKMLIKKKTEKEDFSFFVPKNFNGFFGSEVKYRIQKSIQKLIFSGTGKYDIWHSTYQGTSYYPRNKSVKIIQTIHDLNFLHEKDNSPEKIKAELKKIQDGIDRADVITTISKFTMQEVEQNLRINNQEKKVIYNGCEVKLFEGFDTPLYRPKRPFLFSIGTVLPKKNIHTLPSLLVGNDYELVIAGLNNNPYQIKILEAARKFKVENRIKLIGPVTEESKYWYYKNCEAFLFPSLAEGFGLPVVESMHFGKPLFLSTRTSLPEIGGKNASYFESFDPEDMQEVFKNGMKSFDYDKDSKELIVRSKEFTWEHAAGQYLELYRK